MHLGSNQEIQLEFISKVMLPYSMSDYLWKRMIIEHANIQPISYLHTIIMGWICSNDRSDKTCMCAAGHKNCTVDHHKEESQVNLSISCKDCRFWRRFCHDRYNRSLSMFTTAQTHRGSILEILIKQTWKKSWSTQRSKVYRRRLLLCFKLPQSFSSVNEIR